MLSFVKVKNKKFKNHGILSYGCVFGGFISRLDSTDYAYKCLKL